MADNYLQRSHRQDDSRLGSDDPLMELSRIMGEPEEEESVTGSNDDFAMDLERELMGGFDDEVTPATAQAAPKQEAPEIAAQPAAAYEEPDYADYEPETAYIDSEAGEGAGSYAETAAHEERAVIAEAPSLSLEDELETLLAGAAQPVVAPQAPVSQPVIQRNPNASWGYGSRSHVAGRTEPAPVISRATSYQEPAPEPEPLAYESPEAEPEIAYQAPEQEPEAYHAEPEQAQEPAEDNFDTEELMAAFDDFELEAEEEQAPVEHQEPEQAYAPSVYEPIAIPSAPAIASAPRLPEVQALSDYADELDRAATTVAAPDVHTVAVTENRVDYTEALDLPAVNYEDDVPQHNGLSELETEFAEVFGSIEAETPHGDFAVAEEAPKPEPVHDKYADIFSDVFGNEAQQSRSNPAAATAGATAIGAAAALAAQNRPARPSYQYGPESDPDFGYDPRHSDADMAAVQHAPTQITQKRSSLFVPGVAAAVVLVAVAGAFAYKWTSGTSGEPVVIMADKTPIKVQPETSNSAVVPNQDKAVYDKGATTPEAPKQDKLVTTTEDPVDLSADEDEDIPAGDKVEARVDPADQDAAADEPARPANGSLAPRKVQTMVVKPDGTMVASIDGGNKPAMTGPAAAPAERPAETAMPSSPVAAGDDPVGALAASAPADITPAPAPAKTVAATPAARKLPAKPVETKKITPETVASVAPRNIPVVESRPADQPLDIVDRVPPKSAGQQVASAAPAAGSYLIQVASQPTVEGAQKTYASLSQKYAGVIGGLGVDIKQAEIAGKGTFYRVRIPAGSKDEATNLCIRFKSAGGSCFVTR